MRKHLTTKNKFQNHVQVGIILKQSQSCDILEYEYSSHCLQCHSRGCMEDYSWTVKIQKGYVGPWTWTHWKEQSLRYNFQVFPNTLPSEKVTSKCCFLSGLAWGRSCRCWKAFSANYCVCNLNYSECVSFSEHSFYLQPIMFLSNAPTSFYYVKRFKVQRTGL